MSWSGQVVAAGLCTTVAVLLVAARAGATLRWARDPAPDRQRSAPPGPRTGRARPGTRIGEVAVAMWCEDIARSLRSGATLSVAIVEATDAHRVMEPVIGPAVAAIRRGRSLAAALHALPADPSTSSGLAISVLRTCADLGGPAAAPLERVAATLRTRAAILEEQQVHSAQALLSARVMTLVPVALLALLAVTEPRVRSSLGTPLGLTVVVTGAVLNIVGWSWMRHIIGGRR